MRCKRSTSAVDTLRELAQFNALRPGKRGTTPVETIDIPVQDAAIVDAVAERTALAALMVAIKKTLVRQEALTDAFEQYETTIFGKADQADFTRIYDSHKAELAWFAKNKQVSSKALEGLLKFLELFYGQLYLPRK